jgi:hypothetical protein
MDALEIQELDVEILVEEEIPRIDIAVDNILGVNIGESFGSFAATTLVYPCTRRNQNQNQWSRWSVAKEWSLTVPHRRVF